MAVVFNIQYRLSGRGKREALKAGLDPTEIQSYRLSPGDPYYNGFADLVDIEKIYEDDEQWQWVDHFVGAPYGYKVMVWDLESPDWEPPFKTHIKEWEDPATQVVFDSPMSIEELLNFEKKHHVVKQAAREAAERELARQLESEKQSLVESMANRRKEATQWLEENAQWSQLVQCNALAAAIESGSDIGYEFEEASVWRRAIDAVALANEIREAGPWIKAHGSKRLKQILKENLLATSMSVYRDERLETEHPGWEWMPKSMPRLDDPRNPTEALLDRLETARLDFPDCKLRWNRHAKCGVITATFLGKPVTMKEPVPARQPVGSFPDDDIPF